jgi:diacylglycerol kinase
MISHVKKNIAKMLKGTGYAVDGIIYANRYEQSFLLIGITLFLILVLGIVFKISLLEWAISVFLLGIISACELINTSMEAVIDLICPKIHPLAKIGKDTASSAVFIISTAAFVTWLVIFVPKIIKMLEVLR